MSNGKKRLQTPEQHYFSIFADLENDRAALTLVQEALSQSDGVIADAARLLSLQRTTLIEKMRKYEMRAA